MDMNKQARQLGVIAQIKRAFKRGNRLAASVGLLLGGFIPLAVYVTAHQETSGLTGTWQEVARTWILVVCGLAYSGKSVFEWARLAFASVVKALGFVVLVEGISVTSSVHWLGIAALVYLIGINSVSTACKLSQG